MGTILPELSTVYSEYVLLPRKKAKDCIPDTVDISAPLKRFIFDGKRPWNEQSSFRLNTPFMVAAMQATSDHEMGIATAREGCITTINCSRSIESEAEAIEKTKRSRGGFVVPQVLNPEMPIPEVAKLSQQTGYDRFPVTEDGKPNGRVVGLLTTDFYDEHTHASLRVKDRMITNDTTSSWQYETLSRHIALDDDIGDDLSKANTFMREESRTRMLILVDRTGNLRRAVFMKDVNEHNKHRKTELVDNQKQYKVAAAVNTRDFEERVPAIVEAGADLLVIDASQGHDEWQEEALKWIRKKYADIPVISGNYVTPEGFDFAVANGAHAVKIGIGPGSICTTRERLRLGLGQATAVKIIADRRDQYFKATGIYVPIIADGGIVNLSDITIAFALGADAVMMGRFFAGYHESPTGLETIDVEAKQGGNFPMLAKPYWGEGSERAKRWRTGRYDQNEISEGIEGYVPYKGMLNDNLPKDIRELKIAMARGGYASIRDLQEHAKLARQTEGSMREGSPHDIFRIK